MNVIVSPPLAVSPPSITEKNDWRDVVIDANALCDRVTTAAPGDAIAYFAGMLARDRDRLASRLPPEQRIELDATADYAWRLAEAGWAHLAQRRVGPECFAYLVIVRPRPRQQRSRDAAPLACLRLREAA
jgi:hypothetical protein